MALDESTVDEDTSRRRQQMRHLRTAITLLVLVVFVVIAAWSSWRKVTGADEDEPQASTTCAPTAAGAPPAPADIQLNVYNATSRAGLASTVADQLRALGYTVADVANDPLDREVAGTAEVRSHLDQQAAAGVVVALVPGAVFVPDEREGATVDLVLGETFDALSAADPAAAATSTLPACTPATG